MAFCSLFVLSALFFSNTSKAQTKPPNDIVVKGKVSSDKDNQPLVGVTVQVSTKKGVKAVTDANGMYQIKVPRDTKLLSFSYVGYTPVETILLNRTQVNITLTAIVSDLDEVVIVGYGTQKKINQTGSTETVKFDDAVNETVTNSAQLMYGKFSGVLVTQSSGLPGADDSQIQIRGVGTFNSTNPLIVIDNIQYDDMVAFNNLSPSDIESISVLKDASASSIYGARGANGVVVVTTKQGKKGTMSMIYNAYAGIQEATVVAKYLNAYDYATLINEREVNVNGAGAALRYSAANLQAIQDGSKPDEYANTNWANEILRSAPIQNHYLSFSGGNDKTTYRASLSYIDQEAIVRGKFQNKRYTLGLNLNTRVKEWLTVSNVTNAFWSVFRGPNNGAAAITGETGIVNQFQRSAPTVPVYYSNGQFGIADGSRLNILNPSFQINNPLFTGQNGSNINNTINFSNRFGVKANIAKNLSFETSGSVNLIFTNTSNTNPKVDLFDHLGNLVIQSNANSLSKSSLFRYNLLNENILRYNKKIKKDHELSVLLGHSLIYQKSDNFTGSLSGFPSNNPQVFDAGGTLLPNVGGTGFEVALQSFFSRFNYSYKSKYLFEFNIRRDGSSRFGPNNLYGNFPSASAGWRMTNEKFIKEIKWISELKLRASWGITGNDNIGNYLYQPTLNTSVFYSIGTTDAGGVAITTYPNADIRWEKTKQFDFGFDAGLFRNKLTVTADYFKRSSYDILYRNFPIPSSIGFSNIPALNSATMVNEGIELSLNYKNKIGKVNYNIGASVSWFADNKVISLGNEVNIPTIGTSTITNVGLPFGAYYGYKVAGVFQTAAEVAAAPVQLGSPLTAPGDFRYVDVSGPGGKPDGVIDPNDRAVIGNPYPKYTYNITGGLNYKTIDFKFVFNGVERVDRFLVANGQYPMAGDRNNALAYWINRWTPTNPSTKYARVGGVNTTLPSDFYVQDCSYLRLRNIEIGYNFSPKVLRKAGLNTLRLYISGQNILTFTKFKNFDPERQAASNTDQLAPLYKIYSFGLNVKI